MADEKLEEVSQGCMFSFRMSYNDYCDHCGAQCCSLYADLMHRKTQSKVVGDPIYNQKYSLVVHKKGYDLRRLGLATDMYTGFPLGSNFSKESRYDTFRCR